MRVGLRQIAKGGLVAWVAAILINIPTETNAKPVKHARHPKHPKHDDTFNNKKFSGSYEFDLEGMSSFRGTTQYFTVGTGLMVANGLGDVTGHGEFWVGTYLNGYVLCKVVFSGTSSVSATGLGNIAVTATTSSPACETIPLNFGMALANDGAIIEVGSNDANDAMAGTLSLQTTTTYSLASLVGPYAIRLQGTSSIVRANEPYSVVIGQLLMDGKGKLNGTATASSADVECPGVFKDGVYQIAADGTGDIFMNWFPNIPAAGCFPSVVNVDMACQSPNECDIGIEANDMARGKIAKRGLWP